MNSPHLVEHLPDRCWIGIVVAFDSPTLGRNLTNAVASRCEEVPKAVRPFNSPRHSTPDANHGNRVLPHPQQFGQLFPHRGTQSLHQSHERFTIQRVLRSAATLWGLLLLLHLAQEFASAAFCRMSVVDSGAAASVGESSSPIFWARNGARSAIVG